MRVGSGEERRPKSRPKFWPVKSVSTPLQGHLSHPLLTTPTLIQLLHITHIHPSNLLVVVLSIINGCSYILFVKCGLVPLVFRFFS